MNAVTLQDLTKHFPAFTLDSISFSVPAGSVMGMIGETGAGKSTTIKLILGLLSPDAGTVTIFGSSGAPDREHIGVVFDECCFPDTLSAQDIDRILGMSYRTWSHKAFADYLARFSLPYRKAIKRYARGMKMTLSIACARAHDRRLLVLAEPTSGLDPVVRDEILDIFYDFMQDETHAILISSHITSDLEKICDYVCFLHQGSLALCGEKDDLLTRFGVLHCDEKTLAALEPAAIYGVRRGQYQIQALVELDKVPQDLALEPVKLEDILLFLAKKEA